MPAPAAAMRWMAPRSCSPQSQRIEPRRSPVKHSEWMRTSGASTVLRTADDDGEVLDRPRLRPERHHPRLRGAVQGHGGGGDEAQSLPPPCPDTPGPPPPSRRSGRMPGGRPRRPAAPQARRAAAVPISPVAIAATAEGGVSTASSPIVEGCVAVGSAKPAQHIGSRQGGGQASRDHLGRRIDRPAQHGGPPHRREQDHRRPLGQGVEFRQTRGPGGLGGQQEQGRPVLRRHALQQHRDAATQLGRGAVDATQRAGRGLGRRWEGEGARS